MKDSNGFIYSESDTYDFDIQKWDSKTFIRNVLTYIGDLVAGRGTSFTIYFYGEQTL